jgi:carotenoid cleavage dioxygenase
MGLLTKSEEIVLPKSVMMHDFQITATRVVFMDLPILFDFDLALSGEGFPFRWDPTNGARLGVMPRDGTNADVVWTEIDPCFVFHTWNAFDDPADPAKVVLDAIRYPDMWAMGASDFSQAGAPVRFSIPTTAGGSVGMDVIEERAVEFPRIDPRKQGLPHRYGYGLLVEPDGGQGVVAAQTLAKYDFVSGTTVDIYMPDGLRIDEPTFVPASPDAGEDEGWLFVYGYDAATDKSELVILDATTNQVLARVKLPVRVPHGFHGTWVPGG